MPTNIDSLEIDIQAKSDSASKSLDNLVRRLGLVAEGVSAIGKNTGLEEFAKRAQEATKAFASVQGMGKTISANIEPQMQKVAKSLEEITAKYKDLGKGFTFRGSTADIQKQIDKYANSLEIAKLKKEELEAAGKTEGQMYEYAIRDIQKYSNMIDSLKSKMQEPTTFRGDLSLMSDEQLEEWFRNLPSIKEKAEEAVKSVEESFSNIKLEIPAQAFNYDASAMNAVFGEISSKINNWNDAMSAFGANAGAVLNATNSKTELVKNRTAEFEKALKTLQVPKINEINIDKLKTSLRKTEEQLDKLRAKLENEMTMGRIAVDADDSGFVRLQEQIKLTELRAEALKDKILEVESVSAKTSKFSALSSTANKISGAFSNLGNGLKGLDSLVNKVSRAFLNFGNVGNKTTGSIRSMESGFKRLWRTIAPFLGIYEIFRFGKNAVDTASSLTEVQNVVDVTFGKYADLVDKMAETSISDFGMSELTVKNIASRFQAMGTAMGFAQGKMADMSINLTKLAADMASFYNVEKKDVAEDLESIFTGTTRPLRQYGLDLTQATLQEWAMKNGLDANIQSMSQAEKTMLRYQYVLANTGAAQGDFARTADTWANQIRILKQNFEQLGAVIGNIIINVLKPLVKALNVAMGYIISFAKSVSNALGKIFGWTYEESGGGITMSDDFADAAGSAEDIADATGEAAGNAKKLRQQLQGFDALNNLTSNLDSAISGAGGAGLGGGGGIGDVGGDWKQGESILKDFESDIDNLYELGKYIGDSLQKALDSIDWNAVRKKARNIGKGLAELINGFVEVENLGYTIGRTLSEAINTAFEFLNGFVHELHWESVGKFIADELNGFFENIDWELIRDTFVTGFKGLASSINSFVDNFHWDNISNTISNAINVVAETVYTFFSNVDWEKLGKNIGEQLRKTIEKIDWYMIGKALGSVIQSALNFVISFVKELDMSSIANAIKNTLKGFLEEVDMSDLAEVILTLLAAKLTLAAGKFAFDSAAKSILNGLKGAFASSAATETATTIGTSIGGSILSGIKTALGDLGTLAAGFSVGSAVDDLLVSSGALSSMDETGEKTEIYSEHYVGWRGKVQLLKDEFGALGNAMQGLPAVIGLPEQGFAALEKAMDAVRQGTIYTDKQLEKMQKTWGLTADDIEMLRQEMLDANPVLRELADNLNLESASAETLQDVGEGLSSILRGVDPVADGFTVMTTEARNFLSNITEGKTLISSYADELSGIGDAADNANQSLNHVGENIAKGLSIGITENTDLISGAAEQAMQIGINAAKTTAGVRSPSTVFAEIGKNLMLGLQNGINFNGQSVIQNLANIASKLVNPFKNLSTSFMSVGKSIMSGFSNGISSMKDTVYYKAAEIANGVANKVRGALKIHSPSRVMFELGDYTMEGFQLGIESLYNPILSSIKSFGENLQIAPVPLPESIYGNYQNYAVMPDFNSNSYIQNSYVGDNAETNALLRELIMAVREGKIIELNGNEVGREMQKADDSYYKRTGRGMFQH